MTRATGAEAAPTNFERSTSVFMLSSEHPKRHGGPRDAARKPDASPHATRPPLVGRLGHFFYAAEPPRAVLVSASAPASSLILQTEESNEPS